MATAKKTPLPNLAIEPTPFVTVYTTELEGERLSRVAYSALTHYATRFNVQIPTEFADQKEFAAFLISSEAFGADEVLRAYAQLRLGDTVRVPRKAV